MPFGRTRQDFGKSGLRGPVNDISFERLEGEEYQQDLNRRNGGAMSGRKVDRPMINTVIAGIKNGSFTDDQIEALMYRNPGAAAEFAAAIPMERRINSKYYTPGQEYIEAQPGFQNVPRGLTYSSGEGPDVVPEFEGLGAVAGQEARDPSFDWKNAMTEAVGLGQRKYAQELQDIYAPRQGSQAVDKFNVYDPEGNEYRVNVVGGVVRGGTQVPGRPGVYGTPTGKNQYDKPVQELSKRISNSNIPEVIDAVSQISDAYVKWEETKDAPGVGGLWNMSLSDYFKSPEGKKLSANIQVMENIKYKNQAGANVTAFEQVRQEVANARRKSSTAADFMNHYRDTILPTWLRAQANTFGGFPEAAINRYAKDNKYLKDLTNSDKISIEGARRRRASNVGETIKPSNKPAGTDEAAKRRLKGILDANKSR